MMETVENTMSSIYSKATGYNFVVEFEKLLTNGILNGLTIKDRLHFISEKDAKRWVRDVQMFDQNARYINLEVKEAA
jgi:hypothetical protein